jgi:uncharacterized membrane protein YtjA (UPF0391 family)
MQLKAGFRAWVFVLQPFRESADTDLDNVSLQLAHLRCSEFAGEGAMLKWGLVFFLLAFASGVLGIVDTNLATAVLAQVLFFGNVVLFVVFTLLGAMMLQPVDSQDSGRHER